MRQLVWFTCCVLLLFSGFNALQSLLPQQRPTAGPLTIAAGYLAYAGAALLPPTRFRRWAFVGSALSFALWVLSTDYSDTLLALASIVCGAGSGIFWTNEGAWLSVADESETPIFSAAVLIAFHCATVLGQQLLFQWPHAIYWIALGTSLASAVLLLIAPSSFLGESTQQSSASIAELLASKWTLLIPEIALFGCGSALIWVGLPKLLSAEELYIAFDIFSASSVVGFAISAAVGKLLSLCQLSMIGASLHLMSWALISVMGSPIWLLYSVMLSVGIGNALLNQAIVLKQTALPSRSFSCQVALYCLVYASCSALLAWWLQAGLIAAITLGFSALALQQFQ